MPETRLRKLLEANRLATEHLDLPEALRQIVKAAVEMVGAEFGAIAVLGSSGSMDEFIHVGMDDAMVTRIGALPVGRGLMGGLIAEPIRLSVMTLDRRSVGFPPHHPVMSSFLEVPLEVRNEIFGHLYLADTRADLFTSDDQDLVEALASTAGVAIAHARLFQESRRRELWTAATSRITHELLTNDEVDALQLIARTVLELAGADLVCVVLSDADYLAGDKLVVDRAAGSRDDMVGLVLPSITLVSQCIETGRPQLSEGVADTSWVAYLPPEALGPAMAVPLPAEVGVRGSLFVMRDVGRPTFTEFDLDVAASLAGHAALALDRADARVVRAHAATLEDRDRIARDLHDHAIQRLFATGLIIQSVCSSMPPGHDRTRLLSQIDEIDQTIRQIRNTIFGLHTLSGHSPSVRARILEVVNAATASLAAAPEVTLRGPLDLVVSDQLCDDVVAVVREALTNIGRHAQADKVQISVSADAHSVEIEVLDDGRGLGTDLTLSGLANLRERAERQGGAFSVAARPGPGTRLSWNAPLDAG